MIVIALQRGGAPSAQASQGDNPSADGSPSDADPRQEQPRREAESGPSIPDQTD